MNRTRWWAAAVMAAAGLAVVAFTQVQGTAQDGAASESQQPRRLTPQEQLAARQKAQLERIKSMEAARNPAVSGRLPDDEIPQ